MKSYRPTVVWCAIALVVCSAAGADATNVTACGATSSSHNETLLVTANLSSGGGTCIEITHNNVVLDCQSYVLTGNLIPGNYGVKVTGDNVTVRNCTIREFNRGIRYLGVDGGLIENNTIEDNGCCDASNCLTCKHCNAEFPEERQV